MKMDKEVEKKEKPKRFRPLIRSQVINLLPYSKRVNMSAEEIKRWILDHSCSFCFKPFKFKVAKEFHECKFNRDELKRIPMVDIKSSKFRDSSKVEALESDGNLDASDSESDIGEAEKEMKKYIKDSDSDLSFGSHDDSDEAEKICRCCKEDLVKAIKTEVEDDGTDIIEIQGTYMLNHFSVFCEFGHLCRVDSNLIEKGVDLYLSGVATCHDVTINLKRAGPLGGWYLQYLDGSWWFCVCYEQSVFFLKSASQEYSTIMELANKKLKLFSLASEYFDLLEDRKVKDKFVHFVDFLKNRLDDGDEDEEIENDSPVDVEKYLKENKKFLYEHLRKTTDNFINTKISSSLAKKKVTRKRKRGRLAGKKCIDLDSTTSSIQSFDFRSSSSSDIEEVGIEEEREKENGVDEEEFDMEDEIQILGTFTISNDEETRTILELKHDSEEEVETVKKDLETPPSTSNQIDEDLIQGTSHQINEAHTNNIQDNDAQINDPENANNEIEVDEVEEIEEIKSEPNEMSDDGYEDNTGDSSDHVEILENDGDSDDSDVQILD